MAHIRNANGATQTATTAARINREMAMAARDVKKLVMRVISFLVQIEHTECVIQCLLVVCELSGLFITVEKLNGVINVVFVHNNTIAPICQLQIAPVVFSFGEIHTPASFLFVIAGVGVDFYTTSHTDDVGQKIPGAERPHKSITFRTIQRRHFYFLSNRGVNGTPRDALYIISYLKVLVLFSAKS
jgi:hypothetical protein